MTRRYAFAVSFIALVSASLPAQHVRGVVRDSADSRRVVGAVVLAFDSGGRVGGRAITDARGRFDVPVVTHAVRVHVVRIGYRPTDIEITAPDPSELSVSMARLPSLLPTTTVSDQPLCPGGKVDAGVLHLWEQARSALLAAVVARESNPAVATTVLYRRQLSYPARHVMAEQTTTNHGRTTRPFMAVASAGRFAVEGYMVEANGERSFRAPDADVILDESFAATHCFRYQAADSAHQGLAGVAFSPARRRDDLVDVQGVVWLSAADPRLESVEFQYTELEPALVAAGAGGHLEFKSMRNGVSFIDKWSIRIPIAARVRGGSVSSPSAVLRSRRRQDDYDLTVSAIQESGGAVTIATWADGTAWSATPAGESVRVATRPVTTVTGGVTDVATGTPVLGAEVALESIGRSVQTDSAGRFEIANIPVGTVVARVRHLGHAPLTDTLHLEHGVSITRNYRLTKVRVLNTVTSAASARSYLSPALRGFEERRLGGIGTFIGDSLLRDYEGSRLADVLSSRAPGLRILKVSNGAFAASARDQRAGKFAMLPGGGRRRGNIPDGCFATVYLDGVLLFDLSLNNPTDPPPNLNDYLVHDLAAIEFYGGGASTPAQFRASECGTLLLWTREK